jgi:hypothetical protein
MTRHKLIGMFCAALVAGLVAVAPAGARPHKFVLLVRIVAHGKANAAGKAPLPETAGTAQGEATALLESHASLSLTLDPDKERIVSTKLATVKLDASSVVGGQWSGFVDFGGGNEGYQCGYNFGYLSFPGVTWGVAPAVTNGKIHVGMSLAALGNSDQLKVTCNHPEVPGEGGVTSGAFMVTVAKPRAHAQVPGDTTFSLNQVLGTLGTKRWVQATGKATSTGSCGGCGLPMASTDSAPSCPRKLCG